MTCSLPTREISPDCSARSTFACATRSMSPISSRNSVPPCACSKKPRFLACAPVNAPRSWPKSSLSMSSRGMAAQLTFTNGSSARGERRWMAREMSSLPVPLSPVMSTDAFVGATFSISWKSFRHRRRSPDHLVLLELLLARHLGERALSLLGRVEHVRTLTSTRSRLSGFSKKSLAPSLMACTASCTVACPLMTMMGVSRRLVVLADALERVEAAHVRELHVEDREVDRRLGAGEDGQRLLGGLGAEDAVALALENELQRATDVLLVVDDEDRLGGGAPKGRTPGRGRPPRSDPFFLHVLEVVLSPAGPARSAGSAKDAANEPLRVAPLVHLEVGLAQQQQRLGSRPESSDRRDADRGAARVVA
jgi:hypothetical protein